MFGGVLGLEAQLELAGVPRPLRAVNVSDPAQSTPFGVLVRWAEETAEGQVLIWLLNTRVEAVQVTLIWDSSHGGQFAVGGTDVLTAVPASLGSSGVLLASESTLFLKVPLPR